MLLKRHYDPESFKSWDEKRQAVVAPKIAAIVEQGISEDAAGKIVRQQYNDEHGLPDITHVEVKLASDTWRPSKKIIDRGAEEGWLSIGAGNITIKTGPDDEDVVYKIQRSPGRFCCHCDAKLGSEREASQHVEKHGEDSPDSNNPSGWRNTTYYDCVKESDNG